MEENACQYCSSGNTKTTTKTTLNFTSSNLSTTTDSLTQSLSTKTFSSHLQGASRNGLYIPLNHPQRPWRRNIREDRQDIKRDMKKLSPVFSDEAITNTCEDEIRCAAFALTSLSLSPAASKSSPHEQFTQEFHKNDNFIFPTPDKVLSDEDDAVTNVTNDNIEEYDDKSDEFPFYSASLSFTKDCEKCNLQDSTKTTNDSKMAENSTTDVNRLHDVYCDVFNQSVKPRSYSHRDFLSGHTHAETFSKPRSSSFDAVGRACKYYSCGGTNDVQKSVGSLVNTANQNKMLCRRFGSPPVDDGIGSSSGSADSVDQNPTKRKIASSRLFRCMWRGCDKETLSLNGIIMHVRHAHIGPSNAGEEEFYFDDVNIDSNTTSGISSSEESLPDEHGKLKQLSSPVHLNKVESRKYGNTDIKSKEIDTPVIAKINSILPKPETSAKLHLDNRVSFDIPTLATSSRMPKKSRPQNYISPSTPEPHFPLPPTVIMPSTKNLFTPITADSFRNKFDIDDKNTVKFDTSKLASFSSGFKSSNANYVRSINRSMAYTYDTTNHLHDIFSIPTPESTFAFDEKKQNSYLPNVSINNLSENLTKSYGNYSTDFNINQLTETNIFLPNQPNKAPSRRKGHKKCRKVYGMTNKHLWCTQCRWKKACIRFK